MENLCARLAFALSSSRSSSSPAEAMHSLDHRENRAAFFVRVARFLEDNAK